MKKRLCLVFFIIFGVIYVWAENFGMVFAITPSGRSKLTLYYREGALGDEYDDEDEKIYFTERANMEAQAKEARLKNTKYSHTECTKIVLSIDEEYHIENSYTIPFFNNYIEGGYVFVHYFSFDDSARPGGSILYSSGRISFKKSLDVYKEQRMKYLKMFGIK